MESDKRNFEPRRFVKSGGFVLLLIVLTLLAVSGAILFTNLGVGGASTEQRIVRARDSTDVLLAAKLALIGYAVGPQLGSTFRPGVFPIPDSYGNSNYDGTEDPMCLGTGPNGLPNTSVFAGSTSKRCVGKFPWKSLGFDLGPVDQNDPTGRVPWLAVSANVVWYDNCLKVLNSDSAKLDSPGTPSCTLASAIPPYTKPSTLPHPWLTVVNENGTVLSNRVVAVLIMPASPLGTESRIQQRTLAAPGHPSDYLDDIKIPLGCVTGCTTYDNAGLSNVFVSIPSGTLYPPTAADATKRGQKIPFNDILIYITIDELMPYIERRVVGEMSKSMSAFKASALFSPNTFPWMAPFDVAPNLDTSVVSAAGTVFGMFPFMSDPAASSQSEYRTDFDWALTGFTNTSSCQRIGTSPNRWTYGTLGTSTSGTIPVNKGVCRWRGANRVVCGLSPGQSVASTFQQSMPIYSDNACTTSAGTATLNIARTITSLQLDASCVSPTASYTAGSATDVHRWSSSCASIITSVPPPPGFTSSTISLDATDVITNTGATSYSQLPKTFSVSLLTPATGSKQVVANRMRFHPIMPGWFHENLWYQTAFAAVAPSSAPAIVTPCGGAATLTVGSRQGIGAIAMQAGGALPVVNPGTRPSMALGDYMEGQNLVSKGGAAPGMTNCSFEGVSTATTALANDQIIVVSP